MDFQNQPENQPRSFIQRRLDQLRVETIFGAAGIILSWIVILIVVLGWCVIITKKVIIPLFSMSGDDWNRIVYHDWPILKSVPGQLWNILPDWLQWCIIIGACGMAAIFALWLIVLIFGIYFGIFGLTAGIITILLLCILFK